MKDDVYLLPIDRQFAEARIVQLEQLIQDLGPDFNDAFSQSSETWHAIRAVSENICRTRGRQL